MNGFLIFNDRNLLVSLPCSFYSAVPQFTLKER